MNEGPSPAPAASRRWTVAREDWEIAAALVILTVRLALYWGDDRWKGARDWVLWVALFWIFTALASRTRAWPYVATLLVLILAGIYLEGNLPITRETLRWNLWP